MLVIDASVAIKWLKAEADSDLAETVAVADLLTAPELIVAEVANGCWSACRRGLLETAQLAAVPAILERYLAALQPLAPLTARAVTIAQALDHPVYGCFYLALAERGNASLVTADRRLLARVAGTPWEPHVRDLASFADPA